MKYARTDKYVTTLFSKVRKVFFNFIRRVRALTTKPIVAIGGITLARAAEVIRAGADSIAVVRDILCVPDPGRRARQYMDLLEAANHAATV